MKLINEQILRLLKYASKYRKYQLILMCLFFPPLVLMIIRPFFMQYLIDEIVAKGKGAMLLPFLAFFVAIIVLERLLSFWLNCYHVKLSNRAIETEQVAIYRRVQELKSDYFQKNRTGDITTKVLSDVQMVAPVMVVSVPTIFFNLIGLTSYVIVLSFLSWKLTLITVVSLPLYYISLNLFARRLQNASMDERKNYSKVNESVREKVEGVWAIKGLVKPGFFGGLFARDVENWISKRVKLYVNHTAAQNVTFFITAVTPVLVLGYGGLGVISGEMTLGTLVGFYAYINWIYEPISRINDNLLNLQLVGPVAERFFAVLDEPGETDEGKLAFPQNYSLVYQDVNFGYNDEHILKGINLEIRENETVTLVGVSGSGKSTIANLLCRFYRPGSGAILLNGRNISEYSLEEIRRNVLIVRQNDYLFNMSVKENIVLDDSFTEEEIRQSLKMAGAEEFIDQLPEKLDTLVGERGATLSDGQKQRLCLARALIRKPKILILDEATSALDSNTEEKVFERIKSSGQTVVVIAHRLSTIMKADRVILLHEGNILDTGKHEELLESCPEYANIVASQLIA